MIEENSSVSFQSLLDNIKDYSNTVNILKIGLPECHSMSEICVTSSEIESYESQYLLAFVIK